MAGLDKNNAGIQKLFRFVLCFQLILSISIGYFTDTLWLGLGAGLLVIIPAIIIGLSYPDESFSRHMTSAATQLMAALHIQQTMGMTEMHFQVFVLLAFTSFFRDWKVIVTSTAVIAVHHIAGFIVQNAGGGLIVFEDSSPAFLILVIHALFAILECVVLCFMAKKSFEDGKVSQQIQHNVSQIVGKNGEIHLTERSKSDEDHDSDFLMMIDSVRELVERVNFVGEELLTFSSKVANSSQMLDDTVDAQNNQVSAISEAMRNMTTSIQAVADLSQNANEFAESAKLKTSDTRTVIDASRSNISELKSTLQFTSDAIGDLSNKCQNIAEVMQSIKSVAEQTNLLALNAAIESARAGEHGRGFAVVADEVRNLAIKSKESAEEIEKITELLTTSANNSVDNMNNCVEMVNVAAESSEHATSNMVDVLEGISQVNSNVTQVASSAYEQASTSESISQTAENLHALFSDEKVQVEALKEDVLQLKQLSEELSQRLSKFKIS
ncbi:methyl-accepting chemotaxis protein [Glaciecola sp. 1036]|uniref:methyl-accepting chemotaxis protein n=1 Tax=Alteromonadaceae TaxID=72275 RepID=UPI003D02B5CA